MSDSRHPRDNETMEGPASWQNPATASDMRDWEDRARRHPQWAARQIAGLLGRALEAEWEVDRLLKDRRNGPDL